MPMGGVFATPGDENRPGPSGFGPGMSRMVMAMAAPDPGAGLAAKGSTTAIFLKP